MTYLGGRRSLRPAWFDRMRESLGQWFRLVREGGRERGGEKERESRETTRATTSGTGVHRTPSSFALLIFHSEQLRHSRRQTSAWAARRPIDRHSIANRRAPVDPPPVTMIETSARLIRGFEFDRSAARSPCSYSRLRVFAVVESHDSQWKRWKKKKGEKERLWI